MNLKAVTPLLASTMLTLLFDGCHKSQTSPTTPTTAGSASLTVTFAQNPVMFSSTGCNASLPQGWYTQARLQETSGVNFTARSLIQKLDGNVTSLLAESFSSRFGACPDSPYNPE